MNPADRCYRPDIDGLRALAVGVVLIFHAFPARLPGGFVGVDVFFVISGYLISGIILSARADGRFTSRSSTRAASPDFSRARAVLLAVPRRRFLLYADDYARVCRHVARVRPSRPISRSGRRRVTSTSRPSSSRSCTCVARRRRAVLSGVPVLLVVAHAAPRTVGLDLAIGTVSFFSRSGRCGSIARRRFYARGSFWELLAARARLREADAALDAWVRAVMSRRWLPDVVPRLACRDCRRRVVDRRDTGVSGPLGVLAGWRHLLLCRRTARLDQSRVLSQPLVVFIGLISYPLYLCTGPPVVRAHSRRRHSAASLRLALVATAWVLPGHHRVIERRFGLALEAAWPAGAGRGDVGGLRSGRRHLFVRRPDRSTGHRTTPPASSITTSGCAGPARRPTAASAIHGLADRAARDAIDPVARGGREHTVLLWGDSFAQALSSDSARACHRMRRYAQITTSVCKAESTTSTPR